MKKFIAIVLLLTIALTAVSCSDTGGKLKKIQDAGEMVLYTAPDFPPFEFPGANGIEGVDIELAKAIADELGVKLKIEEAEFESILMSMEGGKGDIAIAGVTITEGRKEKLDFSEPYIESFQYLILPEDSNIQFMEDLAGKKIGVAIGYTGNFVVDDEIKEGVLKATNATMSEYKNAMNAALDIKAGRLDAVVMDEYVAKNIVATNAGLISIQLKYKSGNAVAEEYGVVVPKGNEDLIEKINAVIKRLKDEGKIQEWLVDFSRKLADKNEAE